MKIYRKKHLDYINFSIFIIVYFYLIVSSIISKDFSKNLVGNNDNYKGRYFEFIKDPAKAIENGTSQIYFSVLKYFNFIFNDINYSIFSLKLTSIVIICLIISNILNKKLKNVDKFIRISAISIFVIFFINTRSYLSASNDMFLGLFLVFYILNLNEIVQKKHNSKTFIYLGTILSICSAIRPTYLLLLPMTLAVFLYSFYLSKFKINLRYTFSFLLSLLIFTGLFHYKSILSGNGLSHFDKNPSSELNWTQRNFLGLSKIKKGKQPIHRDAIWKETEFKDVEAYLEKNGENSLPSTTLSFIMKDPILYIVLVIYNFLFSSLIYLRFFGLLFLLPLITSYFNKINEIGLLFYFQILVISMVCLTFIEMRWLFGYQLLLVLGIVESVSFLNKLQIRLIVNISLSIITLFNLLSIFT